MVGEVFLRYQQSVGAFRLPIHPPLVVKRYEAQCAVSRHGQVSVAAVDQAIDRLKRNGELTAMYGKYQ